MKALFDLEKINELKKEDLNFECKSCLCIFLGDKRAVKRSLGLIKGDGKNKIDYCSTKCQREYEERFSKIECKCSNCSTSLIKRKSELKKSKTGNLFCTKKCSAEFNNKNKTTGVRRSKLESWIEHKLCSKYEFEIIFNGKEAIGSELDIYIPSLNLAFEINGIFHYEAIYGDNKLNSIINNDRIKFQSCLSKKIELCVINTTESKNFKPERDIKYLKIIEDIIEEKIWRG